MLTEIRLRRRFAEVLAAALAVGCGGGTAGVPGSSGGGTSSGGTSSGSSGAPTGVWTSACEGTYESRALLATLETNPAIDGAQYRNESAFPIGENNYQPGGGVPNVPVDEVGDSWKGALTGSPGFGTLCAKHSNPVECNAKIAGLRVLPTTREECAKAYPASTYNQVACSVTYIVYTRGDEIGVARNVEETKALINGVNTFGEALWAATTNGKLELACGTNQLGVPQSQYRTTEGGGYDLQLVEAENCGETTYAVTVHVDLAGTVTETSRTDLGVKPSCAVAGRRPAGYRNAPIAANGRGSARRDEIGAYFASMATLEAAAVVAFRRLHRELAAHGAPRELLARVKKAIKDEIRHARTTTTLALEYGVAPAAPAIAAAAEARSLMDIARENAREGCVRETYGAIVAQHQVLSAADVDVRACMAVIADEETEHAALSWDIAAWIESQLGDAARAELAAERRNAVAELAAELDVEIAEHIASATGVPSAARAKAILDGIAPMMLAA